MPEPDVLAAAAMIANRVRRTPLLELESVPGVRYKAEDQQAGGSFKARGALNAILGLGGDHIVTGSSGNHGIAVARIGAMLNRPVTVLMAAGASAAKSEAIRRLGATVLSLTGGVAERERQAREHAERIGATFVPSADHELVVAGAGTVALEILQDAPETESIFVPTGGGGLLAGTCRAAEQLSRSVRIVGVEPAECARYASSIAAGRPVELPPPGTIADGLRGQRPGEVPYPIIRRRVDELIAVTDSEIEDAMKLLHRDGIEAEPSGSAALAGLLKSGFSGAAVVVVSGGNTVSRCSRIGIERRVAEVGR
jgi:threo-3-hydroxy-L-aspartate ammonia-lyase